MITPHTQHPKNERIAYVDAIKAFCMFCVVMMHIWNKFPMEIQHNPYFYELEKFISMFFLSLFFIVSGFFSSRKMEINKILSRGKSQVVGALLFAFTYMYINCQIESESFLSSHLYRCYWFTIALFQMLIFAQIILRLKKHIAPVLILLSLLSLGIVPIIDKLENELFISDILAWREFCFYLPFYSLGLIYGKNKTKFDEILDSKRFRNGLVICLILTFVAQHYATGLIANLISYFCRICTSIIIYYIFKSLELFSRVISLIGKRTLDIYFLHWFFLPATFPWEQYLQGENIIVGMVLIGLLLTSFVILITIVVGNVIRTSPLLSTWLLGAKTKTAVYLN